MIHSSTPLLTLLDRVKQAGFLETYFYFPECIFAGNKSVERADFEYLLAQLYVKETESDSFGKKYTLTLKAEQILSDSIYPAQSDEIIFIMN